MKFIIVRLFFQKQIITFTQSILITHNKMKIKSLFFKAPVPELKIRKSLSVYISEKHSEIIFAPISREIKVPIHFEQEACEVISLNSSIETIGEALKRNFHKFNLSERKNPQDKKSDWPAFKASKEKTIVGFEKNYKRYKIDGANDHNIILKIETLLDYPSQIELTTTISAHCHNSDLGQRLLKINNCDIC